ncbi:hypothetical protein SAY86_030055 [Trapa natans]|uniref:Uncharacterized protein n=1 Tax=Trapa natans TaxID=22666 RepID=A0AAN7M4M8_TRANT|nr:hypothetical protein SAY86_030055 [Trapa natans]
MADSRSSARAWRWSRGGSDLPCYCRLPCSYSSQVFTSIVGLLFMGRLTEPIWGSSL